MNIPTIMMLYVLAIALAVALAWGPAWSLIPLGLGLIVTAGANS